MRFTTLVLVPSETLNIVEQVAMLMAPYDYTNEANEEGYWDGWMLHDATQDVYRLPLISLAHIDPLAVVTPDGRWHELPYRWNETAQEQVARFHIASALLAEYAGYLAVELDCHS